MNVPSRASYEGNNGWADGRLGQAYDLIDAVLGEQHPESRDALRTAKAAVEDADIELGKTA